MNDIRDIERMTLYEYAIKRSAYSLKALDENLAIHNQAWIANQLRNDSESKKPKYTSFKKFFDYEKLQNEILGSENPSLAKKDSKLSSLLKRANS